MIAMRLVVRLTAVTTSLAEPTSSAHLLPGARVRPAGQGGPQ
jgi:hypothetical protein